MRSLDFGVQSGDALGDSIADIVFEGVVVVGGEEPGTTSARQTI